MTVLKTSTGDLTPFWARLPKFFLWPMQMGPMVYCVCLALGFGVTSIMGFIGRLLMLVIWFFFFRYAMTTLVEAARGNFDRDAVDMAVQPGDRRPLKQAGFLVVALMFIGMIGGWIGPTAALGALLLVTGLIPAAIMLIAIEDSFFSALNPMKLLNVVASVGAPYLLLCVFLFLLFIGAGGFVQLVGNLIPWFIEVPFVAFVVMYFMLVMYNMMGYVVYQFHTELGYTVERDFSEHEHEASTHSKTVKPAGPPLSPRDQQMATLVSTGDVAGAIALLKEDMRYDRTNISDNQKLHKLHLAQGDTAQTVAHATELICWLSAAQQGAAALDLLLRMRELDPAFAVTEPQPKLVIAQAAKTRRNAAVAMELLSGFDKKHPDHPSTAAAYYLVAQCMSELQRDDAQAMRILRAVIGRYPNDTVTPDAQNYLKVLESTTRPA